MAKTRPTPSRGIPEAIIQSQIRRPPVVELKHVEDVALDLGTPANIRSARVSPLTQELREKARTAAQARMRGGGDEESGTRPARHTQPVRAATARALTEDDFDVALPPGDDLVDPRTGVRSFEARIRELGGEPQGLATPTVSASPLASAAVRAIAVQDVDRLWDWVRQEPDLAARFFGWTPRSSLDLHQMFHQYVQADAQGRAVARSITIGQDHVGFALLYPIDEETRTAVAHLYLAPTLRGQLATWVPWLVAQAEAVLPPTIRVAIYDQMGWARLLVGQGFTPHTILIKERT